MRQDFRHLASTLIYGTRMLRLHSRLSSGSIRILMYHRVDPRQNSKGLNVGPDLFRRQLETISESYRIIPLGDAVDLYARKRFHGHFAVVTFDDGYRDNFLHAFPILRDLGAPATVFICCSAIDRGFLLWEELDYVIGATSKADLDLSRHGLGHLHLGVGQERGAAIRFLHEKLKDLSGEERIEVESHILSALAPLPDREREMLSWDEIRRMASTGLITIGSHTMTHPILSRIDRERARWEIGESRSCIESRTASPVRFFAYPNGRAIDFNDEIRAMVRESGYVAACTTIPRHRMRHVDPFALPRTDVTVNISARRGENFSKPLFAVKLSGILDGILYRY